MASVTSLDKDMRKLRLDRYTPGAIKEVRTFIEEALGESLGKPDLLDSLKDGVALCKYDFSEVFPAEYALISTFSTDSSTWPRRTSYVSRPRL